MRSKHIVKSLRALLLTLAPALLSVHMNLKASADIP